MNKELAQRKPKWLKIKLSLNDNYNDISDIISKNEPAKKLFENLGYKRSIEIKNNLIKYYKMI